MVSWVSIQQEMLKAGSAKGIPADCDGVRRAKIARVETLTGRPLIVYAVDLQNNKTPDNLLAVMINYVDKDGFQEALEGIGGDNLDILLQSGGGLASATESIVALLRPRFSDIRFMVPSFAKSAATMLALSGNEIWMGAASELGPIDPQMSTGRGGFAPAQAIRDQFDMAKDQLQTRPQDLPAWIPILQQYAPSLLQECQHHMDLAEQLVSTWLLQYMFNNDPAHAQTARDAAAKLNDHKAWKTHSRRVSLEWLRDDAHLNIKDFSSQPDLDEAIRALHIAINVTFDMTSAFKIVENAQGKAMIGQAQTFNLQLLQAPAIQPANPNPAPAAPGPAAPAAPSPSHGLPPNRAGANKKHRH